MNIEKYLIKHREILQLVYGSFLIILIPIIILYNTVFIINNYNHSIDVSLHRHALSLGRSILPYIEEEIESKENIQARVVQLREKNPELLELNVSIKNDEKYVIIASSDENEIDKVYSNYFYQLSFSQKINDGIARDSLSIPGEKQEKLDREKVGRYWEVGMPIEREGKKIGVLTMKISSKIIDQLTQENRNSSLYLLIGEIIFVVLFLLLAVRFWDYALLYKKIKEIDLMKDEFISIASHELRTPVTGIKGYSSMILDGSFGKANNKIINAANIIKIASERLGILVDDLLNVSRIEQGRMELDMRKQNVYVIIKDIAGELKVQADIKNISLKYSPHANTFPNINIDKEKFKQILINIIGNSIKYTEKGTVEISTYIKGKNYLAISVKDSGIGMNEDERKRLFQKFYRVKNEKTKKITGTGLGLWITKKITEMMDGKILVDSIKGAGTEMTIIFPIIK